MELGDCPQEVLGVSQATAAVLADAETSIKAGDWDAAIEQLETLKQEQPAEPEAYRRLAHALAVRGKFQSVISTYLELIGVLVESEQLGPADDVVTRVLGLRPESGEARERRIEIENRRGNTARAVTLSRELARLCIDQGDGERSIRLLQDAQKHEPGNLDISLELAEMFVSHGHIQDGANQYRKVANAFQESGNISKAAEAYRRMKVVQSDDPEVLLTLGRLYTELGKLDEAEQEFRSVLRHDLDHEQALLQLGLVCQLKGRFRSGILAFNKVLQNNPELVEAKRKLGELHHSQGMMPEAVDFFLKAAQGYLEAEDRDDAIECFQIVLSVDENNAPAQQGLTNLGAPVQPKAFEPPQPPTPPEEAPPEPVSVTSPEPVSDSAPSLERTERLPAMSFDAPAPEPELPKAEVASPKKPGAANTRRLSGGLTGGMRKGLVAPGGGDKPMLGGDKPMLGRNRGGMREGLGMKVLGGGPVMGGGGDKPMLGSPSAPTRRPHLERPEPSEPAPVEHVGSSQGMNLDPLEDFSEDMALENVFSDSDAPMAEGISESLEDSLFDPSPAGANEPLDFGSLGDDLFDPASEPSAQTHGVVIGGLTFDSEDDELPVETSLRPDYAGEKPVFDEDLGDELFNFEADPDGPQPSTAPTLAMGQDLFGEDAFGEDLFGDEPQSGDSLSPSSAGDLFTDFDAPPGGEGDSDNDASGLFDGDKDPFGSLFGDDEASVESSAETLGGFKGSMDFVSEESSSAVSSLGEADFGSLFGDGDQVIAESADDDLFSGAGLQGELEPVPTSAPESGLFGGDSNSSDLFQDDGPSYESEGDLFSTSLDTGGSLNPYAEPLESDDSIFGGPVDDEGFGTPSESTSSALDADDGDLFGSSAGSTLFDGLAQPELEHVSSDTGSDLFGSPELSGALFERDETSSGDLFSTQVSEENEELFSTQDSGGGLFDPIEPTGAFDSDRSVDLEFDAGEDASWSDDQSSVGLFEDPIPGEREDVAEEVSGDLFGTFHSEGPSGEDSLFSSTVSEVTEFVEPPPLGLELPMPTDEPVELDVPSDPALETAGLFEDDAVGDLFSDNGFEEIPLEISIPDPDSVPAAMAEELEAAFDLDAPSSEESSSGLFEEEHSSDLFAGSDFIEEKPLEIEIPDVPLEEATATPEGSSELDTSGDWMNGDSPLEFGSSSDEDEPLGFAIPSAESEPLKVDFGNEAEESDLFTPEGDGADLFAQTETEDFHFAESSVEDEPDEVLTMLEMTLPSLEIAPEDNALSSGDPDFPEATLDLGLPLASDFSSDVGGLGDLSSEATTVEAVSSMLSVEDQLEIAQINQAEALEASLSEADAASKIAAFRKALEESPDNLVLRTRLADIHLKYGLLEDAVVQYRQVLKRNSDSIPLLHRVIQAEFWNENYVEAGNSLLALAQLHLNKGEPHDALDALQSVLSLDPLHFEARQALVSVFTSLEESKLAAHHLRQLAETALTKGEVSGAIVAFQQLLEISEDPTLEERLAQIYESQGDVEKALSAFQSLLGRYRGEARWEEAARVTERIVELDPSLLDEREGLITLYQQLGLNAQVVEQQYQLARRYQDVGEASRAVGLLEEVIKVQTENFDARRHLVDAYLGLGRVSSALEQAESLTEHYLDTKDHSTAISLYSKLVEADPENVELQERLVKFYGLAGDPENAKSRWIAISFQHEKGGRFDRAAEALQKALELDDSQLDLLQRLAVLYAEKIGDNQAALVCLRKLFGMAPEKTDAVKMYIDLLLRAEQVSEAGQVLQKLEQAGGESVEIKASVIAALKSSVEANPSDLKTRFNYGELCYHLGDLDHAIEQFQQTRRHPDFELMSYNMLGLCFASKRGYMMLDLAIKQFKKGLETKGRPEQDYLETRYNLAMVLYQNNRAAEALAELRECYNVDIAYRDVRSWIQKIENEQANSGT